jgi:hypothetical protein
VYNFVCVIKTLTWDLKEAYKLLGIRNNMACIKCECMVHDFNAVHSGAGSLRSEEEPEAEALYYDQHMVPMRKRTISKMVWLYNRADPPNVATSNASRDRNLKPFSMVNDRMVWWQYGYDFCLLNAICLFTALPHVRRLFGNPKEGPYDAYGCDYLHMMSKGAFESVEHDLFEGICKAQRCHTGWSNTTISARISERFCALSGHSDSVRRCGKFPNGFEMVSPKEGKHRTAWLQQILIVVGGDNAVIRSDKLRCMFQKTIILALKLMDILKSTVCWTEGALQLLDTRGTPKLSRAIIMRYINLLSYALFLVSLQYLRYRET